MSLFNTSNFNTDNFNDTNVKNLLANILTDSSVSASLSSSGLKADIITSSDVSGSLVYSTLSISASIDSSSNITSNLGVTYLISGSIDTSSMVDISNNKVDVSADIICESEVTSELTILPLRLISASVETTSDISGTLSTDVSFSTIIETSSFVTGVPAPVRLAATIYLNDTEVTGDLKGNFTLPSNFDVSGSVVTVDTPQVIRAVAADITSESTVIAGFGLMKANIESGSSTYGLLGQTYSIESDELSTESSVDGNSVLILSTSGSIDTSSEISSPNCYAENPEDECVNLPVLASTISLAANIDTSSTVSEPEFEIYIRLTGSIIYTNSNVTAEANDLFGLKSNAVQTGGSTITGNIVYDTNLGGISIFTESKLPHSLGSVNIITGSTVSSKLDVPAQLTSRRREVTYVFKVEKQEKTYKTIIDRHYNLMKFYYSLSQINDTLEFTRRSAIRELNSYRINEIIDAIVAYEKGDISELPAPYRLWTSNNNLSTIQTGDRGIVADRATGIFAERDGQFAVYKGPSYKNGQLVD